MKRLNCTLLVILSITAMAQTNARLNRPRLVVGIMIDQMRWDFIYRYYDRFGNTGFRRMIREGFICENTMIPYAQTVTAAGHACVYSGSVPAMNGIMGNEWFDKQLGRQVYCTDDSGVKVVGARGSSSMSPANLWSTTISDELRLATNFQSKVIGIAIKDRGAILPAGHSANAAYWYDGAGGNWISSTYYMEQLPSWVSSFNNKKWQDSFYSRNWNTLFPAASYIQSDDDNASYEGKFAHESSPVFPHELRSRIGKDYRTIQVTPYGNTFTLQFSKEALKAERLGKDAITDLLAISLSSPDYIGHQFGPNSMEIEDTYLRLDKDLGDFLIFLDKEVGKGQYTVFLTADHAVAHTPGYLQQHHMPFRTIAGTSGALAKSIEEQFKIRQPIKANANYQIYFDDSAIAAGGSSKETIKKFSIDYLNRQPDILLAFDCTNIQSVNLPAEVKELYLKGYNTKRGGDIQIVLKPGLFYGGQTGTTHGSPFAYDSHIPLLWMGWGIRAGKLNREVYMTDIAPTLATLLHVQMPSATIGKVIPELLK